MKLPQVVFYSQFGPIFNFCIQHCFICRPVDPTCVPKDVGIEPKTVVEFIFDRRSCLHLIHIKFYHSHHTWLNLIHNWLLLIHPQTASHPHLAAFHPHLTACISSTLDYASHPLLGMAIFRLDDWLPSHRKVALLHKPRCDHVVSCTHPTSRFTAPWTFSVRL
jgi:hypothetical protein